MPRPSPQTDRVVAIVTLLTERGEGGATLTEVARHVGQTPAACVHVLAALAAAGWVVRHPDDRRYRLGPALVAPGRVAALRFPAFDATRLAMEELARATGHPVVAITRDGAYARLVDVVATLDHPAPPLRIGDLLPIEPPLGAVFVAWDGPEAFEAWLARWHGTPGTRAALRERLAVAREQGFIVELSPPLPLVHELARVLHRGQDARRAERLGAEGEGSHAFLADRLRATQRYEVAAVVAPVASPEGRVDLALTVVGFDTSLSGREVRILGERARGVADALAYALHAEGGAPG